jgi:flagellum-specific ATP synthase
MPDLADRDQLAAAGRFKDSLATYQRNEDMINLGAYQRGASPEIDQALERYPHLMSFLKQPFDEPEDLDASRAALMQII